MKRLQFTSKGLQELQDFQSLMKDLAEFTTTEPETNLRKLELSPRGRAILEVHRNDVINDSIRNFYQVHTENDSDVHKYIKIQPSDFDTSTMSVLVQWGLFEETNYSFIEALALYLEDHKRSLLQSVISLVEEDEGEDGLEDYLEHKSKELKELRFRLQKGEHIPMGGTNLDLTTLDRLEFIIENFNTLWDITREAKSNVKRTKK